MGLNAQRQTHEKKVAVPAAGAAAVVALVDCAAAAGGALEVAL